MGTPGLQGSYLERDFFLLFAGGGLGDCNVMAENQPWLKWMGAALAGGVLLLGSVGSDAQTNDASTNAAVPTSVTTNAATPAVVAVANPALGTNAATAPPPSDRGTNQPGASTPDGETNRVALLSEFQIKRGFRIEVAAAEPDVAAPSALAFDEHGRLYVAEMRDYPHQLDTRPSLGRIRLLEDPEDNGVYRAKSIFAEGLATPAGLACYGGGVFVTAGSEILYLKDTDGDGRADVRQVVFSGFVRPAEATSEQYLNSLAWGLDGRIHGLAAGLGGNISGPGLSEAMAMAGEDFSFDPRLLDLRRESGGGRSGLAFDNFGHKFVCDLTRAARQPMLPWHYLARAPFLAYGSATHNVSLPAVAIYREDEKGRRTTDWMRHANGLTVYRGDAFPTNYVGSIFIPDRDAGVIHRALPRDYGLEFYSERPADEAGSEFLSARDPTFHPTQVVNGPDGCLYVADFRDGRESGRVYRIQPVKFERRPRIKLEKLGDGELAALLGNGNGWVRDTATRLLCERRTVGSAFLLSGMLGRARSELTRLHVLCALASMGAISETNVVPVLRDSSPVIREHGLRVAESLVRKGVAPDSLWAQFKQMSADSSLRVRFQLALSAGQVMRPDRVGVLASVMRRDPGNEWLQTAVLSSANEGAGLLLASLASDSAFRASNPGPVFLARLASQVGVQGDKIQVQSALDFLTADRLPPFDTYLLLRSLGDGLNRTRSSLALVDVNNRLVPFMTRALEVAVNDSLPRPLRAEAIQLIGVGTLPYQDVSDLLLLLLGSGQGQFIETATVSALARFSDPRAITNLLARWNRLNPAVRPIAVSALLAREERVPIVLAAIRNRVISTADVPSVRVHFLRTHRDAAISQEALRIFSSYQPRLENFSQLAPALKLAPDPGRGRGIYRELCAGCHRLYGEGQPVGPDLAELKVEGKEPLLRAIVEPAMHIRPGYAAVVAENPAGENAIGILERQNPQAITLAQPGGTRLIWSRPNVGAVQEQSWSLMPEGLLTGLSQQQVADLLGAIMIAPR